MIARAVVVAETTTSKHRAPVVAAILADLAQPEWPNAAERERIRGDVAQLTGGKVTGLSGLYASLAALGKMVLSAHCDGQRTVHLFVVRGTAGGEEDRRRGRGRWGCGVMSLWDRRNAGD